MIDDNPSPILDYRTRLAIETLKEDRDKLAVKCGDALLKLIEYERAFYPHSQECSTCSFLHQFVPKTHKYHRHCPGGIGYDTDPFICELCVKFIKINKIKYDDICFKCICNSTKLDDLEKEAERRKLFYDAYNLSSLIG